MNTGSPLAISNASRCCRTSCSLARIVGSSPAALGAAPVVVAPAGAVVVAGGVAGVSAGGSASSLFSDSSTFSYFDRQSDVAVANALKSEMNVATIVRGSPCSCAAAGSFVNSASAVRAPARCSFTAF